jgi:predicted DNA-binding transcriptional regulator YafY
VAQDVARGQWRTFHADRALCVELIGTPVEFDDAPDAAAMVSRVLVSDYPVYATIRLPLSLERARRVVAPHRGIHQFEDANSRLVTIGGADIDEPARHLLGLPTPFDVLGPRDVIDAMREHLSAACGATARIHGWVSQVRNVPLSFSSSRGSPGRAVIGRPATA